MVVLFSLTLCVSAQENEVTVTESVRVVNVEVPVRVFLKGSPVDNLTRASFKIFEDGKPQKIHGFYIRRRKLAETVPVADPVVKRIRSHASAPEVAVDTRQETSLSRPQVQRLDAHLDPVLHCGRG